MILYCYISHNKKIQEDFNTIQQDMLKIGYDHYKVFYCGAKINFNNDHVINLECNDNYEGLPNKIHTIAKYLVNSDLKNYYTHIYKIDATNSVKSKILLLPNRDYYGYLLSVKNMPEYRRKYHFNRCSKNSEWNTKRYDGDFVPYCAGGYGYVLSFKALECLANNPDNNQEDIYEDLYVAKVLLKCGIRPHHIDSTKYLSKI